MYVCVCVYVCVFIRIIVVYFSGVLFAVCDDKSFWTRLLLPSQFSARVRGQYHGGVPGGGVYEDPTPPSRS